MNRAAVVLGSLAGGALAGYFVGGRFGTWRGHGSHAEQVLIGGPAAWGTALGTLLAGSAALLLTKPAVKQIPDAATGFQSVTLVPGTTDPVSVPVRRGNNNTYVAISVPAGATVSSAVADDASMLELFQTNGMWLFDPIKVGTANITVVWTDAQGQGQSTTIPVTVTGAGMQFVQMTPNANAMVSLGGTSGSVEFQAPAGTVSVNAGSSVGAGNAITSRTQDTLTASFTQLPTSVAVGWIDSVGKTYMANYTVTT